MHPLRCFFEIKLKAALEIYEVPVQIYHVSEECFTASDLKKVCPSS